MKWILFAILLLSVFLSGFFLGSSRKPAVTYTPDVKPPVSNQLQNPDIQTSATIQKWLHESIQRESTYDAATGIFQTRAFTSWTESLFTDKIVAPAPKRAFNAGPFVAIADRSIYYGIGGGYTHYFNNCTMTAHGYIGKNFFMLAGSVGRVMY